MTPAPDNRGLTGAMVFVQRGDSPRTPMAMELLTDAERTAWFADKPAGDVLAWLHVTCRAIQRVLPLLADLEARGIIERQPP